MALVAAAKISRVYGRLRLVEDAHKLPWRVAQRAAHKALPANMWRLEGIEPHVSLRLKQIFASIPKAASLEFDLPDTAMMAQDLEWFMARYPLEMSEEDRRHLARSAKKFRHDMAELGRIHLPGWQAPKQVGLKPGWVLRDYQQREVEILRARGSLLNGDIGGLGKMIMGLGFLASEPAALPGVIVCDAHMQSQWLEKAQAATYLNLHPISTTKPYDLPPADAYVFRVTQLAGWVDVIAQGSFKSAIYDEPQNLRTGTSTSKGRAAQTLSRLASWRLGLTGTPIYNYAGDECWNVLQFIDDTVLGSLDDFRREWCWFDGTRHRVKDARALGTYLRESNVFIRHTKREANFPRGSPPIVENVDYDAKAVAKIEDLAHALALRATTGSFIERGQAARELDMLARMTTGVAKARGVAAFVRMLVEGGEPVVLWGWHRDVYDIWLEELKDLNPVMYTGSETPKQKDESKRAFIEGRSNILIMSLRSGQGVDGLQHRCSTGIIGELDWSPMVHQQCLWRLERDGQKYGVSLFYLVSAGGSDPPMIEMLGIKKSEATELVDPHEPADVEFELDSEDAVRGRLKALAEHYLAKRKSRPHLETAESAVVEA